MPKIHKALPLVLWMGIITVLSLARISGVPKVDVPNADKYVHSVFYFVLTFCVYYYLSTSPKGLNRKIIYACMLSVIYGIIIEVLQGVLTNYRHPDFKDVLANTFGSMLAGLLIFLNKGKLNFKK